MAKLFWIIAWFATQRIMMAVGHIAYNTLFETALVTLIGFFVCFLSYDSWLLPFYIAIAIAWGIATIVDGALVAGILIIVFHLVLIAVFNSAKSKKMEGASRRRRRRWATARRGSCSPTCRFLSNLEARKLLTCKENRLILDIRR